MASDLLGTLFKAMSGLNAFTRGLDNLSNNVANLNTTGYKANDVFYRELQDNAQFGSSGDDGALSANGQGVAVGGTRIRFVDGDLAVTGRDTDMALEGNGLFILRDGTEEYYSRAGEFDLDEDGHLVDPGTGYRVARLDAAGNLTDINLRENLVSNAQASTEVLWRGTLNLQAAEGTVFPAADATDTEKLEFKLYDADGRNYTVFGKLIKLVGSQYQFEVLDENDVRLADAVVIEFSESGAPTQESLRQLVSLDFYDAVPLDIVNERFAGVTAISIADTPGDLDALGDIAISLSEGEFVSRPTAEGERQTFHQATEFRIDADGFLIEKESGQRMAARDLDDPAVLVDARIVLESAAEQTTTVVLSGQLSVPAAAFQGGVAVGDVYPPLTTDADGNLLQENPLTVSLVDDDGQTYAVTVSFLCAVSDADRVEYQLIFNRGEGDEFSADRNLVYTLATPITDDVVIDPSSPLAGLALKASIFDLPATINTPSLWTLSDTAVSARYVATVDGKSVDIDFALDLNGTESSAALAVGLTGEPAVEVAEVDGREVGLLSAIEIDDEGRVIVSYSNGDVSEAGPVLAIVDRNVEAISLDFTGVNGADFVTTTLSLEDVDGRATGQLTGFSFEADGTILLEYSNGDEVKDGQIALALFSNTAALIRAGDALFRTENLDERILGTADEGGFGRIVHKSIERSNVELSREFAEIIIVQRGFQAASQVLNATNELIQELYDSTRGGR